MSMAHLLKNLGTKLCLGGVKKMAWQLPTIQILI